MKRLIGWGLGLLLISGALFFGRQDLHAFLTQRPDFAALHTEPVIMYGTSWCQFCKQARTFLDSQGIAYYEYDIEASVEGQQQYTVLNGRGTPVFLIGNQVIRGYNPAAILAALTEDESIPAVTGAD
ncbi:glutaredoxin family protein [Marinobacterium jannaschii]|uniref:glutaredoxin family protein n=1 Tax=Marinobacterium jannaschii TaxID=64970 RepID=UPI0006870D46|nr:glutaredoxin family protein [Marinobacterium jannaschii]